MEEDDDTKYVFGDEIFEEPIYFEEDIEDRQFESLNQLGPTNRIDINSEWVSAIDREVPSFDMKKLSKYLAISSNKSSYLQQDDNQKLIQGGNVTIGSFARSIHEWSKDNNVQSVGIDALMTILSKTFNGYKLPVKVVATTEVRFNTLDEFKNIDRIQYEATALETYSEEEDVDDSASLRTEDLSCGVLKSTVHEYSRKSTRYVAVDQCECDRYVYVGINNQFLCPKCGKNRFRPCKRNQCSGNGETNCEHLRSVNGDGISYKQLFYRPLLVLISDLLRTPNFLCSLRYEREDKHLPSDHQSERIYSDLMDGNEVQHHLSEMHLRYIDWSQSKPERSNSEEVSLVLSEFYDGGQLFKSKTYNFWILMTQILNLPPTFRGKLGIGMFLSAIYSGRHLEAEKFLFTDMYCEELRLLYDGAEIHLKGKRYFIQARLILHTLDTKALEAVLCLQSASMASYGCPLCRCITGVHDGSKPVYIGHRNILPLNSYLRYIGQSGKCCPAGFYDNEEKKQFDSNSETYPYGSESFSVEDHDGYKTIRIRMQREMERHHQLKQSAKTNKKFNQDESDQFVRPTAWETVQNLPGTLHFLQFCQPCDGDKRNETAIKKFLFVHEHINYYWSNNRPKLYDICKKDTGLRKYLIYRHFDLRSYKPYARVTYGDHLENAIQARGLNEKNNTQSKKHCEGIQDVWPFERLPYANISQQVTWPFLHSICGVIKLLVELIFGDNNKEVQESILKETTTNNNEQVKPCSIKVSDDEEEDGFGDDDPNEWENDEGSNANATKKTKTSADETKLSKKESMRRKRASKMAFFYRYRTLQSRNRKQPYESDPEDRKKCREWFQCIILPKGLGDDSWNMQKFIINDKTLIQGYMKMNQKLKLISCFWDSFYLR